MPDAIIKGVTSIRWGTSNILGTPAGAVVEEISRRAAEAGAHEIADGDGYTVAAVLLNNGFDLDVTCLYDSAKSWPNVGDTVTVSGLPGVSGAINCVVAAVPDVSFRRKAEGTITLRLMYRPHLSLS